MEIRYIDSIGVIHLWLNYNYWKGFILMGDSCGTITKHSTTEHYEYTYARFTKELGL